MQLSRILSAAAASTNRIHVSIGCIIMVVYMVFLDFGGCVMSYY